MYLEESHTLFLEWKTGGVNPAEDLFPDFFPVRQGNDILTKGKKVKTGKEKEGSACLSGISPMDGLQVEKIIVV